MANRKNSQIRSKVERLVDIMFSDVEIPADTMVRMRAWLADSDKAEEKSDALYGKFNELFKFNSEPVLAVELWPDLARRLGMDPTPVVATTDPLGISASAQYAEPEKESTVVRRSRSFRKVATRVAAVLVPLLVIGGVALWLVGRGERSNIVEISVPPGETRTVTLPDGSVVEAGPGTTLSYDESGFADRRLVSLAGEAMFDVEEAFDESGVKIPFSVEADNLTVNVLGTVFNLSTGSADTEAAEISLYEGSVEVTLENDSAEQESEDTGFDTVLDAGERLTVNTHTGEYTTKLIPATEMAGAGFMPLLRFDEATLGDLATALELNYDVKFNIAGGIDPAQGRYSGSFENIPLDETLEMLSKIDTVLSFERSGDGGVNVKRK